MPSTERTCLTRIPRLVLIQSKTGNRLSARSSHDELNSEYNEERTNRPCLCKCLGRTLIGLPRHLGIRGQMEANFHPGERYYDEGRLLGFNGKRSLPHGSSRRLLVFIGCIGEKRRTGRHLYATT